MIRKLYKRNIKHIAFDLDGVLIDSIALMEKSWIFSMKKLNLNYKFIFYKKYLGYPFIDILCKMKIPVKYHKKIITYPINKMWPLGDPEELKQSARIAVFRDFLLRKIVESQK